MPDVRTWDGKSYDRSSGPMEALGREVLSRLELEGDETVLDAGCGSGRITQALIERLPQGRVIAIDASAAVVAAARERLSAFESSGATGENPAGPEADSRVEIRIGDLLELDLGEQVDAVFSTATFHWISDHDRLFTRLRAALRSGGQLVAQCGGE